MVPTQLGFRTLIPEQLHRSVPPFTFFSFAELGSCILSPPIGAKASKNELALGLHFWPSSALYALPEDSTHKGELFLFP